MIRSPNATLHYEGTEPHPLWVMEYSGSGGMAGTTYQSKTYRHWYPLSYQLSALHVIGRVQTQQDYADLAEYIRGHQIFIGRSVGLLTDSKLLKLTLPSEGLLLTGVIKSFTAGRQRFNPAPPWEFDFEIYRDPLQDRRGALVTSTVNVGWLGEDGGGGPTIPDGEIDSQILIGRPNLPEGTTI
jgi:hypothetical protein